MRPFQTHMICSIPYADLEPEREALIGIIVVLVLPKNRFAMRCFRLRLTGIEVNDMLHV